MSSLEFFQFPCRQDNYAVLVHDPSSGQTAAIDAPEFKAIDDVLIEKNWMLTHILSTHKHFDHVEGNQALKAKYGCHIIGPKEEEAFIPGIDSTVSDGDEFEFSGHSIQIIATPGHTLGQIAYYLPESQTAFTADALFALGCGRIFEGTYEQMYDTLCRLVDLPADTRVFAGHEYTLSNAEFAITIDPENADLIERVRSIKAMREKKLPTLPSTIQLELDTNPFLRSAMPSIRKHLGMSDHSDLEVFTEIRRRKDRF